MGFNSAFKGLITYKAVQQYINLNTHCNKLNSEILIEVHKFKHSLQQIKVRNINWGLMGYVALMEKKINAYRFMGKDFLKDLGAEGKIIIEWIVNK